MCRTVHSLIVHVIQASSSYLQLQGWIWINHSIHSLHLLPWLVLEIKLKPMSIWYSLGDCWWCAHDPSELSQTGGSPFSPWFRGAFSLLLAEQKWERTESHLILEPQGEPTPWIAEQRGEQILHALYKWVSA